MRIERVELRLIQMLLVSPFETSFGREFDRPAIIVSVASDGEWGYGECVAGAGPWYSYETTETAWQVLEGYLVPAIFATELTGPEEVPAALARARVRGHNMARAALEAALWDLFAKREAIPLASLLNGSRERIESGVSVGIQESIPALLDVIAGHRARGYRRIKIKIKPGWDLEVVETVRERFPDLPLTVDANSAYTLEDLALFQTLDRLELSMIEQPLAYDDLVDHAALQRRLVTPICLDESISGLAAARAALRLGSCRIINIKPGRVGGLGNARRIHDLCQEHGVPVWCGGMLETGIGRAHNVHLASLPNFQLPNDISESARYYEADLVTPLFELNVDGTITVPTEPGIGVAVRSDRLAEVTVRKRELAS
ncbi:MAG: o-succinylbenzoate synthase [Candidatus Bipolaricaulia bacterium]